jgi:hypothetical protein
MRRPKPPIGPPIPDRETTLGEILSTGHPSVPKSPKRLLIDTEPPPRRTDAPT